MAAGKADTMAATLAATMAVLTVGETAANLALKQVACLVELTAVESVFESAGCSVDKWAD